jgi:DNA-binding response OmpR family regulator
VKTEPRSNLDGVEILLVEDDPLLALGLTRNLQRLGAVVTSAPTLLDARRELARKSWAVVVLDQMLPDGDGLSILETLDEREQKPAIVAVSANLQNSTRSLALQNSDAVLLPKPFSSNQLLVAISRALGRRESEHEALARAPGQFPESGGYVTTLEFGPISLGLLSQSVQVDGEPVDLQPAQFRILATLLANVGRPLPVTELAASALRGTHQDGTVNIRFQIHGLRRRLGARGALIETCPGGYGIGVSAIRQNDAAPPDAAPDSGVGKS